MDKTNSLKIIDKTFSYPFNEETYSNFLYNIFDNIDQSYTSNWLNNALIPNKLKETVKEYKVLGTYKNRDNNSILMAMIKLKDKNAVEKSRYIQRDFSKWLLNKFNADACLISFSSDNYEDWRFSFVKIDFTREITKSGKLKATEIISPLKRYSYLVGKNEPNHTAQIQLSPLLLDENKNPSIEQLTEAFSVEKVTQDFYRDYLSIFKKFEEYLLNTYHFNQQDLRMYTQVLFNRLMFIRFVEKKNWLKFNNSFNYLFELFKAGNYNNKSFFNGRLKPLFFEGLAQEDCQKNPAYGNVCFLNGGLFEQTVLDKKVKELPNKLFEEILNKDGLFYRYNFTVEESTSIDVHVSIDPEMLGKVFEELVTGRNETGAFYTPRDVVTRMCKDSLKSYFKNDKFFEFEQTNSNEKKNIKEKLLKLKILDPACGSGAYLIAILNELVKLHNFLDKREDNIDNNYNLKLSIINNNLYGVDIDEIAVQIAQLRLWLSLIIEYEGKKPEPLPNLDFKIEKGDSLSSRSLINSQPDMFLEALIEKFDKIKFEYQSAKRKDKKERLKKEIIELKKEIKINLFGKNSEINSFEWKLEFAEVFKENSQSGFDIILSNPPYIRHEKLSKHKGLLEKNFELYDSQSDIYVYFFELCTKLLADQGILTIISSNKWLRVQYGKKMRNYIKSNFSILYLIDFGGKKIFSSATVDTAIAIIKKDKPKENHKFYHFNTLEIKKENYNEIYQKDLQIDGFNFLNKKLLNLKKKIDKIGKPLLLWDNEIFFGIKTGLNEAYYIDEKLKKELIKKSPLNSKIIKPTITAKEIKKYYIDRKKNYLLFIPWHFPMGKNDTHNDFENNEKKFKKNYTDIYNHLNKYKINLKKRNKSETGIRYEWYALQRCAAKYSHKFSEEKIIWSEIVQSPKFYLDRSGSFIDASAFMMTGKNLKYLLAVLNSKTFTFLFKNFYSGGFLGEKGYRYKKIYLEKVPIPFPNKKDEDLIEKNVEDIINLHLKEHSQDLMKITKLENSIEKKVQDIYQLNDDEIKLIEKGQNNNIQ
ncbi:BREX-1 system adenine-specific DNA-methyltransferase PglX [Candidatus Pelagibacter sp.]|nr:BREX-1 system adenine-specific DNA-methyltransferase PglX [Candidatus Pelagibacter sp.]